MISCVSQLQIPSFTAKKPGRHSRKILVRGTPTLGGRRSTADAVMDFFANNPDEGLTQSDVSAKYGIGPNQAQLIMSALAGLGLLRIESLQGAKGGPRKLYVPA